MSSDDAGRWRVMEKHRAPEPYGEAGALNAGTALTGRSRPRAFLQFILLITSVQEQHVLLETNPRLRELKKVVCSPSAGKWWAQEPGLARYPC